MVRKLMHIRLMNDCRHKIHLWKDQEKEIDRIVKVMCLT